MILIEYSEKKNKKFQIHLYSYSKYTTYCEGNQDSFVIFVVMHFLILLFLCITDKNGRILRLRITNRLSIIGRNFFNHTLRFSTQTARRREILFSLFGYAILKTKNSSITLQRNHGMVNLSNSKCCALRQCPRMLCLHKYKPEIGEAGSHTRG